jgi:1-acyl-sn-glycerol-3-phosphate acyltransferase
VNSRAHETSSTSSYDHSSYLDRRRILRFMIDKWGFWLLAKLDRAYGLENIPTQGPAILMINHIAFIDPIVVLNVVPRDIVPLAKAEVYDLPLIGIFPKLWGVIPVHREEFDRAAIRQVMDVLGAGEIVLVAPEATRSPQLREGKEGIAYLASRSGAPIVPVAIEGTEEFPALRYTQAWRGPGARLTFGSPFRFRGEFQRADREQLRTMTDEAMYILSALLPPEQRGYYADLTQATQNTIEFV